MQFRSDYHKKKVLDTEIEAIIKLDFSIEGIRKAFDCFFSRPLSPFHGTKDIMPDDPMKTELPFKKLVLTDQARGRIREKLNCENCLRFLVASYGDESIGCSKGES